MWFMCFVWRAAAVWIGIVKQSGVQQWINGTALPAGMVPTTSDSETAMLIENLAYNNRLRSNAHHYLCDIVANTAMAGNK